MKIFNHPLCTTSIGAPSDMLDDCSALPVAHHTDEHGTWTVSFWKPDAAEIATLVTDGGITLQVRASGRQHPVVAIGVYPALTTTTAQIDASDSDPDMGRSVSQARAAIAAALDESVKGRLERLKAELAVANEHIADLIAIVAQQIETPKAASDVLAERRRQVEQEGWTPEHDDKYRHCELARAAATYALCSHPDQLMLCGARAWPWKIDCWKRTTYRRDLIKSGALLLAEIERIDRATVDQQKA